MLYDLAAIGIPADCSHDTSPQHGSNNETIH